MGEKLLQGREKNISKSKDKEEKVNLDNNEWSRAVGLKLSASESLGEFV